MIFITTKSTKFCLEVSEELCWKKGLTDGLVKSIIVEWGIIKLNTKNTPCHGSFYVSHAIGCQMRFLKYRSGYRITCTSIGHHWCSAYISMKSMKTVVFDSSSVARLGRYAKTKSRMKYFGVGGMTSQNHHKPCFIFLQSALRLKCFI